MGLIGSGEGLLTAVFALSCVIFTGFTQGIAIFHVDEPIGAEIILIVDANTNGWDGPTGATRLWDTLKVNAAPAREAISAAVVAAPITTLFF